LRAVLGLPEADPEDGEYLAFHGYTWGMCSTAVTLGAHLTGLPMPNMIVDDSGTLGSDMIEEIKRDIERIRCPVNNVRPAVTIKSRGAKKELEIKACCEKLEALINKTLGS